VSFSLSLSLCCLETYLATSTATSTSNRWLLSFIRTVYEEKRVSDELETRQAAKMDADATLTPLPEHLLKVATIKYGLKEKVAARYD
jgi:hypothetical protein